MGRFVNADAFASTGQGILGCNMFVYCENNPVGSLDLCGCITYPFGAISEWLTTTLQVLDSICGNGEYVFSSYSEVTVSVSAAYVVIDAYVVFDRAFDSVPFIIGTKAYWEGEYDFPSGTKTVIVNIHTGKAADGRAIFVHFSNDGGTSYTWSSFMGFSDHPDTEVMIYKRADGGGPKDFLWSIAHEFGHVLGIADYYTHVNKGELGYIKDLDSVMNKGEHSANRSDIIMAICASALGRWMDWTPNGG